MKNAMVMLFHTHDAAERFCDELKQRGFDSDDMCIIDRNDLPEYGRGQHAAATENRPSGFLEKVKDVFGGDNFDVDRYHNLTDYLEDQGLDRADAEYYENEVVAGSQMLIVKAGDRYQELQDLANKGVSPNLARDIGGARQPSANQETLPERERRVATEEPITPTGTYKQERRPEDSFKANQDRPIVSEFSSTETYRSDVEEPEIQEMPEPNLNEQGNVPPGAESRPVQPNENLKEDIGEGFEEGEDRRERPAA